MAITCLPFMIFAVLMSQVLAKALSERVAEMAESQTIAMAKKARELAGQGVDIVNLTLGEPDFATPQHICNAAKASLDKGFTFYTAVPGILPLRQAIAEKLKRDNGLEFSAENIVVSTGAKQCIANACMALINPGDEVLILGPYWVSYLEIVKMCGGVAKVLCGRVDQNFKPSKQQVKDALSPNTKLLMYSSPSNPTGAVFGKEEMEGLAALVESHPNLFVIADEIYEYIVYEEKPVSLGSFKSIADRVITVNGFSKGFAMTGWRIGYMEANKTIANACEKIQGQFTSATSAMAQYGALEAMTTSLEPTYKMVEAFKKRRDLVCGLAAQIPGISFNIPEGAFYLFPNVAYYLGKHYNGKVIDDVNELSLYLLETCGLSTVPGDAFGDPECIRLSFAASEDKLKEGFKRLKAGLAALQ